MKKNDTGLGKQPILLTVDSHSSVLSTVDLAVDMAVALQSNLHGLFIEDEELVKMAKLPQTREISFPSGQERLTTSSSMQRSLRATGENFRLYLESTAHKCRIHWSYEYVRGKNSELVLDLENSDSLTIVGQGHSLLPQTFPMRRSRKVLVIEDNSPYLLDTLRVVMRRFEREKVEIILIRNKSDSKNPSDISEKVITSTFQNVILTELDSFQISDFDQSRHTFDYAITSKRKFSDSFSATLKTLSCPLILFPS